MSYAINSTESCVETKKHLKLRIKMEKKKLKDFFNIVEHLEMPWDHKQQAIGGMYLNILGMKRRLKENYGRKK